MNEDRYKRSLKPSQSTSPFGSMHSVLSALRRGLSEGYAYRTSSNALCVISLCGVGSQGFPHHRSVQCTLCYHPYGVDCRAMHTPYEIDAYGPDSPGLFSSSLGSMHSVLSTLRSELPAMHIPLASSNALCVISLRGVDSHKALHIPVRVPMHSVLSACAAWTSPKLNTQCLGFTASFGSWYPLVTYPRPTPLCGCGLSLSFGADSSVLNL